MLTSVLSNFIFQPFNPPQPSPLPVNMSSPVMVQKRRRQQQQQKKNVAAAAATKVNSTEDNDYFSRKNTNRGTMRF